MNVCAKLYAIENEPLEGRVMKPNIDIHCRKKTRLFFKVIGQKPRSQWMCMEKNVDMIEKSNVSGDEFCGVCAFESCAITFNLKCLI